MAQKKTPETPTSRSGPDRLDPGAGAPQTPGQAAMGGGSSPQISDPAFDVLRKKVLYSPDDPNMAVQNVMADMGIPGYNPIARQTIMPAAEGLGGAFALQQAQNPAQNGTQDVAEMFRQFLQQAIGGQNGGIYGALGSASQTLQSPGLAGSLRDAFDLNRTGSGSQNPFLGALLPLLSDPSALLGLQQSLSTGLMGRNLAQGQTALGQLGAVKGYRQMGPEGDFLNSLFGS